MDFLKRDRHGDKDSGSRKEPKSFCLHGHTHSKDRFEFIDFCCYNVALDAHNCRPVRAEQIKEDIRQYLEDLRNGKIKD